MPDRPALQLGFDLAFEELYRLDGLQRLDGIFHSWLRNRDGELAARLLRARTTEPDERALAALIVDVARHLDDFLAQLFGIKDDVARLREHHALYTRRFGVRRNFVQRRAALRIKPALAASLNALELQQRLDQHIGQGWDEERFADAVLEWSANEKEAGNEERLRAAMEYAAWAVHTAAGRARHAGSLLFRLPHRVDPMHLIEGAEATVEHGRTSWTIAPSRTRPRDGFALQDHGFSPPQAQSESHYCVQCHGLGKDSCRTGMREPAPAAATSATTFKKNAFGHAQVGCPLEERISEFHALRLEGRMLGALAIITIDNPTLLMTGHRVCNECMQACIYQNQRQEPVNTPAAESRTLDDVLQLPWGFEILSLLTRWNPLKPHQPLPAPPSGYRVLVVGSGPAGIGLSQHLLDAGHAVIAIDARPLERIDPRAAGFSSTGAVLFEPICDAKDHARRHAALAVGFGGTVESGIVGSRWDKTKLVLQRLLLERRRGFELRGGIRLGSGLRLQEAMRQFDHIALCLGAMRATDWSAQQAMPEGVRFALDFLSTLQRGGAADPQALHALSLRLPVLIVGGGLTAIDAATEALAYYPVQVERFLAAYESLHARGLDAPNWTESESALAHEYLEHARALRAERLTAAKDGRALDILELVRSWGGVRILYRRKLTESPAYTLNAEEVGKALEEGIAITEQVDGMALEADDSGWIRGVRARDGFFRAGSVLIAIGSEPDVEFLTREGLIAGQRYLQSCDDKGVPIASVSAGMAKPDATHILVSRTHDGRYVSQLGDLHPSYAGNVVRALGSAKNAAPIITRLLARNAPRRVTQEDRTLAGAADETIRSVNAMDDVAMKLFAVVEQAAQRRKS